MDTLTLIALFLVWSGVVRLSVLALRPGTSLRTRAVPFVLALALGVVGAGITRIEFFPTAAEIAARTTSRAAAEATRKRAAEDDDETRKEAALAAATPDAIARAAFDGASSVRVDHRGGRVAAIVEKRSFLTAGFLRTTALADTAQFAGAVFAQNSDIDYVEINHRAPLTDLRGHEDMSPVMRIVLTRRNAATIDWRNVEASNLPRIADEFWEHPALSR